MNNALEEFFKILTENQINDPLEIHLTVGDFNSHIGNEQENHVTSEEWRYIPRRQGDPQNTPTKMLPTTDIFTTSSPIRGRFLLEMINSTEQLIANGRFEIQGSNKT